MPLISCPECGTMVSATAKACPQCGASAKVIARGQAKATKKPVGRFGKIAIGGAAALVVAAGLASTLQHPVAASQADAKADAQFKQRGEAAAADAISLKQALRDPDSLTFEKILASDDGDVVCIIYRARNGFGGMNREHAVFTGGPGTTSTKAWNKHCAHVMLDNVTGETVRMMELLGH